MSEIFTKIYQNISMLSVFCITVFMILFALHYSEYGFDFSDEGFYLFWLADPSFYRIHIPLSFFGFAYHPIYQMAQGNTVVLRQANVLLTFGGAWALCILVLRSIWPQREFKLAPLALAAAGIATTALGYFSLWWLVTPSYNSLAFQGMLLTFIGVVQAGNQRSWRSALGWACISLGGWLVFLAKPSTAALLGPGVLLCLLVSGKRDIWMLVATVALASGLVLLSALLMDGSANSFAQRIIQSIELLRILGSGQEFSKIFRIDGLPIDTRECGLILALVLALLVGAYGLLRWPSAGFLLTIGACLLTMLASIFLMWQDTPMIRFGASVLVAVPIAGIMFVCLSRRNGIGLISPHLPLALLLLTGPHIYSFGTNGNYWSNGSAVALFWVLSGVVFFGPLLRGRTLPVSIFPLVLVFQFLTTCLLVQGIEAPYRQEHSFRAPHVAWNLRGQGEVMLSSGFRDYLAEARQTADLAGFTGGTGMIDLTGRSPGLLYDLGARSLGQPWLVGDYPGSDALAVATLRTESCEALASAWLLAEPAGPRRLSVDTVLKDWGANLSDFALVGWFKTAKQAGGYAEQYEQLLFKPTRSEIVATERCKQTRQLNQDASR